MWMQANIFGEKLEVPKEEKLNEVCCESCYTAKEEKCTCKCHGAYHGLGNLNHIKPKLKKVNMELGEGDSFLTEDQAAPFRKQINRTSHCCDSDLSKEPIRGYPHQDGWKVQGYAQKLWLFIKCPYCGNEVSIWKIGVSRDFDPAIMQVEASQ